MSQTRVPSRARARNCLLALLFSACSEATTNSDASLLDGVMLSDAVHASVMNSAGSVQATGRALGSARAEGMAYLSLPPGSVPTGVSATVRHTGTNESFVVGIVDGGFDPVPIRADARDTVEVTITLSTGGLSLAKAVVPARRAPRVVRTSPTRGRTDVAINARITVIFSEPVDPSSADSASIHVVSKGVSIGGSVLPLPGSLTGFEFRPTTPLRPATDYALVLDATIRDLSGDALQGVTEIDFTTASLANQPPQSGVWVAHGPLPTFRYMAAGAVVNGILYVVGGRDDSSPWDDDIGSPVGALEAFNPATGIWTRLAPMPTPRYEVSAGVIDGILYTVGGMALNGLSDVVEAYDPATNRWTTRAPLPSARAAVGVGVIGQRLYALGGYGGTTYVPTALEAFDPVANTWSSRAPLPGHRTRAGVGVWNGKLYVVGGWTDVGGRLEASPNTERYDPETDSWTQLAAAAPPQIGPGVGVIGDWLYQVGGGWSEFDIYDLANDSWNPGPPSPVGVYPVAGVIDGVLYVVGMRQGDMYIYSYRP